MNMILALFPLVGLIGMGYIFKRTRFLQDEFWGNSEKLNYYILFPALLFSNLADVKLELSSILSLYICLLLVILLVSVLLLILKVYVRIPVRRFGVYLQSQIRFNTYIGLSLMGLMFGATGMHLFAMIIAVAIPVVNVLSVWSFSQSTTGQFRQTLISIGKNPLILACVAGILFNLSGLNLYAGAAQLLKLLASTSLPLGLISVGAALQFSQLKPDFWRVMWNSLSRLLLVPVLTYAIGKGLGLEALHIQVLVVFFALPTASASYILTRFFNGDSQLMAAIISMQTLLFALSFPVLMQFLF